MRPENVKACKPTNPAQQLGLIQSLNGKPVVWGLTGTGEPYLSIAGEKAFFKAPQSDELGKALRGMAAR